MDRPQEPTGASRRAFLAGAGLTGVAAAAGSWTAPAFAAEPDIAADAAAPASGRITNLTLDGASAGWVESVEGGNAKADVVTEKVGPDHIARKHIAGVKYEDFTVTVGTGMSKAFYGWVKDTFDMKVSRKSGELQAADFRGKVQATQSFSNALITEIGFPALDAASKDAAKMTIKFSPEHSQYKLGGGSASNVKAQKPWLVANFRLKIDRLDTKLVQKIGAITIKQAIVSGSEGNTREPGQLEIPNLSFVLAESGADSWLKWFEDFVIKGNNSREQERAGELVYLAPDNRTALFTLGLGQLGIFNVTPEKFGAGADQIRRTKVELYCDTIKFSHFLQK